MSYHASNPFLELIIVPKQRICLGSILGGIIDRSCVCRQTLNPILLLRQLLKSDIISDTGTLSCGLLGPEQQGTTVDKSNSTTCVYKKYVAENAGSIINGITVDV